MTKFYVSKEKTLLHQHYKVLASNQTRDEMVRSNPSNLYRLKTLRTNASFYNFSFPFPIGSVLQSITSNKIQ
jgi:hypothetical protein